MVLSTKVVNCDEHTLVYDEVYEIDFVVWQQQGWRPERTELKKTNEAGNVFGVFT